jgi:CHAD domain-containing protein
LRIACKNLRYSSELLGSLENRDGRTSSLIKLQDILGKLNDCAVAIRLLNELRQATDRASLVRVHAAIGRNHSKYLGELREEWKKFQAVTI